MADKVAHVKAHWTVKRLEEFIFSNYAMQTKPHGQGDCIHVRHRGRILQIKTMNLIEIGITQGDVIYWSQVRA